MKFISVRDLRLKPGEIWKLARKEKDLVITSRGKPVALLTNIEGKNLLEELEVLRRLRALKALDNIQSRSVSLGTEKISDKEIEDEIKAVRRSSAK
ncbi:MAG: type II toxin-antitoxin system prevent-host-death family antitoxin [Deltaproteobacteria bacterium]|mgnify:CR=1 FL=1|nr:type II toxin-antitoxin system prevent-host-death family antitoxin [Deltaproteobacteria bacterium]MBW1930757.1 type II toxin-antitoxin system prevent-host-death family antitoxin [Deltaproteobacteria bacterium]MBW2023587.1 type II toxin-antitoxin system prevent-host-death family antitoxin [Deltaproteobacteria bacterium]